MKQDWEIKKLGDVAIFINGDRGKNYPSQNDFVNKGIPFINAGHLLNGEIDFMSMNYIDENKYNQLGSGKIINGDLLFCLRGTLGKRAIVENVSCGAIASSLCIIRSKNILNKYLYYYLGSSKVSDLVVENNNGTSQPNLSAKSVSNFPIPIPPLSEQEQIVSELDLISGVIEKKKQQLKELDSLAQSVFYEMFGNPVENDKVWEKIPFEKSIEKVKYTTKIPSCNYCGEGMFPIISQEDEYISGYWNNSDDVFKISKPIVVFGDHTRILKYIDFDFVLGADGVKVLQPVDSINARFFKFYLELSKIPSLGYSRHYKLLKELNVFTPPLSLQQEFASKIERIEKQKELIKQSLKDTETLFNSRMDYYFN